MRFLVVTIAIGLLLETAPAMTALLIVPAATPPVSTALAAALDHYRGGRFTEARACFRALADVDSAIAETMLGTMYARGEGVRADQATASAYYFRAAQRGYAPAQLALARAFETGQGVTQDHSQAWLWARRAQQRGDPHVVAAATAVLARFGAGRPVSERASLDAGVNEWRPWANGRE